MSIGAGWTRNSASGPTYMELEAELARLRSALEWCMDMIIGGDDLAFHFREELEMCGLLVNGRLARHPLAAAEREETSDGT